jgi:DNA repair protein SbcC/Rad50
MKMADTINELYSKYTEGVGYALEEDKYFQYLFEMIQAGDNTLEQKNRILHKVVDERWLTVVEEGIEAIFNIVDKPRRFITTSEEVVPVALAKKITADSVRHLSQNTQYIMTNEAGDIMPTKILNVTTEESYDLYENRFVYHLIQRLFAFVDKRTDVIFWSTGDETCNVMSMESKVDDAYEEISYKVEMTIKNRQSLVENDNDNMDIFKRIDRVRRMSRVLRTSSFCDIMNGCSRVHSPIQRTNLMMKDPDYRTCYKLWQFIEGYDEVGYTIEEQDSTLQFDEEYLLQMYINMITNYTVFKSLLVSDPRKMSEIETKKREPVKPKFVKEIKEEIVEDRNIPDVEIRRVFVEEVTQAQLDAEEKLKEETAKREELENSVSELQFQMESLNQQLEYLDQIRAQLEEQQAELEQQHSEEMAAYEKQLADEKQARAEAQEAVEQAQTEARMMVETVQREAAEEVAAERKKAAEEVAEAQRKAANEIAAIQRESDASVSAIKEEAQNQLAKAQKITEEKIAAAQRKAAEEIAEAQRKATKEIAEEQREAAEKIAEVKENARKEVKAAKEEMKAAKKATQKEIAQVKKAAQEETEASKNAAEKEIAEVKKAAEKEIESIKKVTEKQVKAAQKAKEKAEDKAEANSLSHYIVQALQERKERKNTKNDGEDK